MFLLEDCIIQYRYRRCYYPSIAIASEGITHVVGENGSGKTTLLYILSGLLYPQQGVLRYKGEVITESKRSILYKACSLLLQNNYLFNRRVRDNLYYPLRIQKYRGDYEEAVYNVLADVHIDPIFLDKYPYELSGGEQQRIALAVRLLKKSPVLLLDEPTAHLDKDMIVIIQSLLRKYQNTTKIIVVAHNSPWLESIVTQTISL